MSSNSKREIIRERVHAAVRRLTYAARMAAIAAGGPAPEDGAQYIISSVAAMAREDVKELRSLLRALR